MAQLTLFLLAGPAIVGGRVAAVNSDAVNDAIERAEKWSRDFRARSGERGRFRRYAVDPVLWLIEKFSDWTDGFDHRGIKNGVRSAAALYLALIWLYLLFAIVQFIVIVAVVVLLLIVVFNVLSNSDNSLRRGYETGSLGIRVGCLARRIEQNYSILRATDDLPPSATGGHARGTAPFLTRLGPILGCGFGSRRRRHRVASTVTSRPNSVRETE